MKRAERRHLKQNELQSFARQVQGSLEEYKSQATWIVAALVAVGLAAFGFWAWRDHVDSKVHAMLADALVVQEARIGPPAAAGASGLTFPTERERSEAVVKKFQAAADA